MKTLDEALDEHCKQVFNEKKSSEFVNQAQISFTKGSLFGFESGVKHTKEEYEEKLRWIPVEEKLPKDNILVEVLNESCTPKYSHSVLKKRMWVNPYLNVYISPVPTHWRFIL